MCVCVCVRYQSTVCTGKGKLINARFRWIGKPFNVSLSKKLQLVKQKRNSVLKIK